MILLGDIGAATVVEEEVTTSSADSVSVKKAAKKSDVVNVKFFRCMCAPLPL